MRVLITGGAGFVGSSVALKLKERYPQYTILCMDNLKRRGSELNVSALKNNDIVFLHGDIRNIEDFEQVGNIDLLLECSAEASVLAGYDTSPSYLINTNLMGTINCLEHVRKHDAEFIFLSSSRVYPIEYINNMAFKESDTRFELTDQAGILFGSSKGVNENFPLDKPRTLYGATKLASELIIQEYAHMYGIKALVNRCGVLTGPGQFGKSDQGVIVLWIAKHFWKKPLKYIGYGGEGKQVRDILHVDDLFELIDYQINNIDDLAGETFNVGGGEEISISLLELTALCEKYTGNKIQIDSEIDDRQGDIRVYLTDHTKVTQRTGWRPKKTPDDIVKETYQWIVENELKLKEILE